MDVLIISYNGIMGTPILVKNPITAEAVFIGEMEKLLEKEPNLFDEDILKNEIDYGYMLDKIKNQIQPLGYDIEWFTDVEINKYEQKKLLDSLLHKRFVSLESINDYIKSYGYKNTVVIKNEFEIFEDCDYLLDGSLNPNSENSKYDDFSIWYIFDNTDNYYITEVAYWNDDTNLLTENPF